MNYRKKPVVIQAVVFTGQDASEIEEALGIDPLEVESPFLVNVASGGKHRLNIETLEGTMYAEIDDYIVKGVKGELYPVKPDIFVETYDLVDDQPGADNKPS